MYLFFGSHALVTLALCSVASSQSSFNSTGCKELAFAYPSLVFAPSSSGFSSESTANENWSQTCVLIPTCLFEPTSASVLAGALRILEKTQTSFAVRSGGHMPVPGAANIADGVLISMSRFDQISLSPDHTTAQIGSGLRWTNVYNNLGQYNLTVAGGRYGDVGVGGLLLGGGINYFGGQVGWSMNTVVNYEVVLADGTVVNASAKNNTDLWWALKGGSSNFGLVTRFTMTTIPVTQLYGGLAVYQPTSLDSYINAIANYMAPGGGIEDPLAAIDASVGVAPENGTLTLFNIPFHRGPDPAPKSLAALSSLPTVQSDVSLRENFTSFALDASNPLFNVRSYRRLFWGIGVKATPQAVYLANTTFFQETMATRIPGLIIYIVYQPISASWIKAAVSAGGDAFALDPANGPLLVLQFSVVWTDPTLDKQVIDFTQSIAQAITAKAKAAGLSYPFVYLNDAAAEEDVFSSYGGGNSLPKLRTIAKRYDPHGVFQHLQPGGFKLY